MYSLTLRMPSASLRENLVILWEVILCFCCHLKSLGGWAGHPDNSMTRMDPESYFISLTAWKEKQQQQQQHSDLSEFLFSVLFYLAFVCDVNGYIINANRCCLRLVHFLSFFFFFWMYNLKPPHWLSHNTATCSVFPMALLYSFLFYA